jgi:DNA-binding CsgD family transcriptional regulator
MNQSGGFLSSRIDALKTSIREAPLSETPWPDILAELAEMAGGWGGQLIACDRGRFRAFHAERRISREMIGEFVERGGSDPNRNPRAANVYGATPLSVFSDDEAVPEVLRRRHVLYREFFPRIEADYALTGLLANYGSGHLLFTMNRTRLQGSPDDESRRVLAALLPELKTAAELQLRLDSKAAALALGALDAVEVAAVLCDQLGRIVNTSTAAARLLGEAELVKRANGCLQACAHESDADLQAAIGAASSWINSGQPQHASVLLRSATNIGRADICPVPRGSRAFGLGASILVLIAQPREAPLALLKALGLTLAESEIARDLASGLSPEEIALNRGVSITTLRAQQRSIYGKLDVHRASELSAKVRRLT